MVSPTQFKTGIESHPTSLGQDNSRQPLALSNRSLPACLAHILVMSMTLAFAVGAEGNSLDADNPCNQCSVLDIDENGEVSALSDGLLVIRHLFGPAFAGAALTSKALSPDSPYAADERPWEAVAENIDGLYF